MISAREYLNLVIFIKLLVQHQLNASQFCAELSLRVNLYCVSQYTWQWCKCLKFKKEVLSNSNTILVQLLYLSYILTLTFERTDVSMLDLPSYACLG